MTAGKTNREIAAELFLSEKTVETHLATPSRSWGCPRGLRLQGVLARGAGRADEPVPSGLDPCATPL